MYVYKIQLLDRASRGHLVATDPFITRGWLSYLRRDAKMRGRREALAKNVEAEEELANATRDGRQNHRPVLGDRNAGQ